MSANRVSATRKNSCPIWLTWCVVAGDSPIDESARESNKMLMLEDFLQKVCRLDESPPPGTVIYSTAEHSIYEVDGEEHKV